MAKTILIIDNDIDTMSLLKRWLEKKGYVVAFTNSGDDVSEQLEELNPHLIIIDVLRNDLVDHVKIQAPAVPVLLMTGYTKRARDILLPVDGIIEKPFSLSLLEKKIVPLIKNESRYFCFCEPDIVYRGFGCSFALLPTLYHGYY